MLRNWWLTGGLVTEVAVPVVFLALGIMVALILKGEIDTGWVTLVVSAVVFLLFLLFLLQEGPRLHLEH